MGSLSCSHDELRGRAAQHASNPDNPAAGPPRNNGRRKRRSFTASDDNFGVSPTQTADAARRRSPPARALPPAVTAAAAAEYAAWAAPPPEHAQVPAGGLRVAAWPVTLAQPAFRSTRGPCLSSWGDVIDAWLTGRRRGGRRGLPQKVRGGRARAANANLRRLRCCAGAWPRAAVPAVVFAGRRVRELAFAATANLRGLTPAS